MLAFGLLVIANPNIFRKPLKMFIIAVPYARLVKRDDIRTTSKCCRNSSYFASKPLRQCMYHLFDVLIFNKGCSQIGSSVMFSNLLISAILHDL